MTYNYRDEQDEDEPELGFDAPRYRKAHANAEPAPPPVERVVGAEISTAISTEFAPPPRAKECAVCKFPALEYYKTCPQCEGKRNRERTDRVARAIRELKKAEESGDDRRYREARLQCVQLAGSQYVNDFEHARKVRREAAELKGKPKGLRIGHDE